MSDDQMLEERRRTWHGFVKMMAGSVVVIAIALILMGIFLV